MGGNFLKFLSILFFSVVILLLEDYYLLGSIYFYSLVFYIGLSIFNDKKVKLIDVWNLAFLFIILSEVFLVDHLNNSHLAAIKFLLIANNLINMGYLTIKKKNKLTYKPQLDYKVGNHKIIPVLFIFIVVFYFIMNIQNAIYTFSVGRNVVYAENAGAGGSVLNTLLSAIGLIMPAIIAYYYVHLKNKSLLIPILYSLPIFFILFLEGTRFPLLFSLLGMFIVIQSKFMKNFKPKHYVIIGVVLIGLAYVSSLMKHLRSSVTKDTEFGIFEESSESKDLPSILSNSFMSPEGVIDMTSLMFQHFEHNDHLYGGSSSFILYFWVPRSIWPEKPTMIGHWLIRQYRSGFGESHSSSFGFTGDLYADFGLFSLVVIFIIGRMLKYAENYKDKAFELGGYNTIIGSMLFPYTFFFVRSPITASMTFFGIMLVYFLMKKIIFR